METQEEVMTNMESNSVNHDDNEDREFESSPFRTENDKEDQSQHDHGQIVKGKRTKRQRPQSPIPFHLSSLDSSPATSAAEELPATTEEEKDMANCLILLARGRARPEAASSRRPSVEVGLYVYECKTCSRTFPSFQALGGHRASHKKPKLGGGATATAKDDKKHHHFVLSDEEGGGGQQQQHHQQFKRINNNSIPSLSLQLDGIRSNKLHECSICGAEFMSGQALGGHMRRHRGPVTTPAATANTALTLTPMATEEAEKTRGGGGGGGLTLDLNLPAAAEDESSNRESAFAFASKQQKEQLLQQEKQQKQPHLVFSTPTLVDCHY